ncbi:terminase [Nitrosospira lacus]|uniref:Terminase small subunit n=1 Tax=Nitrosospira lacus TaxID=1288494 RepID=A0A1W6STN5_9PROT|nr:terminase small subunit [Nitrosospira lacus]ARO89170.1 terminase [Nitrosospira lacus]
MSQKDQLELTLKQRRFAEEYCVDLNATAAYIRAGYGARSNSAEAAASRLLSNVKVQKVIEEKQKEIAKRCEVTAEKVIREVSALAFSDVRKLFNADGSLKAIHELDDATAAAIASIEVDPAGVRKIKVWDKNRAQEHLCKHFGLFDKDNSQKPHVEQNVQVSFVPAPDKSNT